jgi:hypothetical protein
MSAFQRIKECSGNSHCQNFGTILELHYGGTGAKVLEQLLNGENAKAYIVKDNHLEVASYTPLPRNESMRSPLQLHIDSYSLNNVEKVSELYDDHRLQMNQYFSLEITITFKNGESISLVEPDVYYNETNQVQYKEDTQEFLKALKTKL